MSSMHYVPDKRDGQYVKADGFFCGIIQAWWETETNTHEISEKTAKLTYY